MLLLCCSTLVVPAADEPRRWPRLAQDGLHDPANAGLRQLQEPADGLSRLAPDTAGNLVRWVEALDRGQINPRANLRPDTRIQLREDDILLNLHGGTPIVRFPHRQHTLWLDCTNCHDVPFVPKAGGNRLSMDRILRGEQCGLCHGAVSFPLTECNRCHSVSRLSPLPADVRRPEASGARPEPAR